jgi:hypothetical protein
LGGGGSHGGGIPALAVAVAVLAILSMTTTVIPSFPGVMAAPSQENADPAANANSIDAAADAITCSIGFGGGNGSGGDDDAPSGGRPIPAHQINDNYCDCPATGADETLTGACSGFENWSGLGAIKHEAKERYVVVDGGERS